MSDRRTKLDEHLDHLRNHRILSVVILAGVIVIAIASLTDAIDKMVKAFSSIASYISPAGSRPPRSYKLNVGSPPWLRFAWEERGVSDQASQLTKSRIQDYLNSFEVPSSESTTDWSAAFVNWALTRAGYPGIRHNDDSLFLSYGKQVSPREGCIALLRFRHRQSTKPVHHSGFLLFEDGQELVVLSGNSSNRVQINRYQKEDLVKCVYPEGA